ncbi:hypothetical protein ACJMK2_008983 [Sinanodonta woodiana]|uniref:Nucleoporin SEH1 n=1 Tax=Sinanodonta woodiana TaxID=1069815 RepID=A0ABD3VAX0_SINWO
MFVAKSIQSGHKDLIHDVAYDFHGRRMATCSSDQTVKIWDHGDDGEWHLTANWKTHSGSVWRVTWAHPEFGQVIATCSFDRTAAVWEEMVGEKQQEGSLRTWLRRSSLVDSRTSVTDVKFAPKHLGLQLATCSADGIVRIYEAPDVMNLNQWSLQNEISCKLSCSCVSWNTSRIHPPMIAVGSDDTNLSAGGKVQIYEYNDSTRKWNKVETIARIADPVYDLAFAPNLGGRNSHLLAIASKNLKIISIEPLRRDPTLSGQSGFTKFDMKEVAEFNEHEQQVWRVSWNVTGTVLASSGDDSSVRLWKANYLGSWKCIAVLMGDGIPQEIERPQFGQLQVNQSAGGDRGSGNAGVRNLPSGIMNLRRNTGWPSFNTKKDQSNVML